MAQKTVPEILANIPVEVSEVENGAFVTCAGVTWSIMPSNYVLTGSYGTSVDTTRVSREKGHEDGTSGVPGVYYKTVVPKGNTMIYEKGRCQSIGSESENRALLCVHLAAKDLVEMGIPAIPTNFYATNTTITVKPCDHEERGSFMIDLKRFAKRPEYVRIIDCNLDKIRQAVFHYSHPELLSENMLKVVFYNNGNFNIMGGKAEHRYIIGRNMIRIFTHEFIRQMEEDKTPVDPENVFTRVSKKPIVCAIGTVVHRDGAKRKREAETPAPKPKRSKKLSKA